MNVPKLRFREFSGEWEYIPAEQLFENIVEKNCSDEKVLTIIQGTGTVLREDSGRDILFDETTTDNYKKVQKGDFIIHLRSFQAGLEIANSDGIVSPAYTILRSKKTIGAMFYRNYFYSNRFINQTLCSAVEGVRDGRQISYSRFKQIPIASTTLPEQQKIADFLSVIDEKIKNQQSIVERLEAQKKGLMQKIFSQELRFKNNNGCQFPKWKQKKFTEVAKKRNERYNPAFGINHRCIEMENISRFDGKILGYCSSMEQSSVKNIFSSGNILFGKLRPYLRKFALPRFSGVCSSEIWVFEAKETTSPQFLFFFVQSDAFMNIANISSGTKMPRAEWKNIEKSLFYFPSLPEQQKVADFLSAYDEKIDAEKQILTHWKTIKKALLQQMFV